MRTKINRSIPCVLTLIMVLSLMSVATVKAKTETSSWRIERRNSAALDEVYPLESNRGGASYGYTGGKMRRLTSVTLPNSEVTYGYTDGKVAIMDTCSGKLIKKTSFTEINEIQRKGKNVDAIVVKEIRGKRLFGVIDKNGKTLIPASNYTEIYFKTNGFRAVDDAKKNYFISRSGKILCTHKNGEKIMEYDKYFAVINERSLAFQAMYDYNGNKVESLPEMDRTAANQYYMIQNTLLADMKDKAVKVMQEQYPNDKVQDTYVTPVGNCYIIYISIRHMDGDKPKYLFGRHCLFDLQGNLITTADNIYSDDAAGQYVTCWNATSSGEGYAVEDGIIYNAKDATPTAVKFSFKDDFSFLETNAFGDYIVLSKLVGFTEGESVENSGGIIFDENGTVVKEINDMLFVNNFLYADGKYYNNKMEEVVVDGQLLVATDGYMIEKDAGAGKVKITFTDKNLNKITAATFDKSVLFLTDIEGFSTTIADFDILQNGSGVHLYNVLFDFDNIKHYFVDKKGTIVKTFTDSKEYRYCKVETNGSVNNIVVLKTQKAATVKLGQMIVTYAKSTNPGELTLKWKTIKGVTAFHVEITSEDHCQYIPKDSKTNNIVVTGLTKGMTYTVIITAYVDRGGIGWSDGVSCKKVKVKIME